MSPYRPISAKKRSSYRLLLRVAVRPTGVARFPAIRTVTTREASESVAVGCDVSNACFSNDSVKVVICHLGWICVYVFPET